jgi:hypothetical protein
MAACSTAGALALPAYGCARQWLRVSTGLWPGERLAAVSVTRNEQLLRRLVGGPTAQPLRNGCGGGCAPPMAVHGRLQTRLWPRASLWLGERLAAVLAGRAASAAGGHSVTRNVQPASRERWRAVTGPNANHRGVSAWC